MVQNSLRVCMVEKWSRGCLRTCMMGHYGFVQGLTEVVAEALSEMLRGTVGHCVRHSTRCGLDIVEALG